MFQNPSPLKIAVYGSEIKTQGRGVGLWSSGYQGCIAAAGATPVFLQPAKGDEPWDEVLADCAGVVVSGFDFHTPTRQGDMESLCLWARRHRFPLLAIDKGLLAMNTAFGGTLFLDLPREQPEALQHRHPPEPGLRHAINVLPGTRLCKIYGEGEIVVNSEHRSGLQKVANGFVVSGSALDGIVEAIEFHKADWFAMGVQWQPASATASGLDIQVFRGLIDAAMEKARPKLAMAG